MHYVDQIEFEEYYGDCVRACLASILEFPLISMPNFWRHTQDPLKYWMLTDSWLKSIVNTRSVLVSFEVDSKFFIRDLLCVAMGEAKRGEDHAVVWRDGLVHDPHPERVGLTSEPDAYLLLFRSLDS